MSTLEILGRSTQATHIWVKQASEELKWNDERRSFLALRAVLHALRDRLTIEEAVQLGAQLPTFIRGSYYDGWRPKKTPVRDSTRYGFLGQIQAAFAKTHDPHVDAVHIARAIFRLLSRKVSEGEINDLRSTLPRDVRDLWPETYGKKKTVGGTPEKKRQRTPERHPVEELITAAEERSRAVLGLAATLQALNVDRAWEIMYSAGETFSGCECPRCAALFPVGNDKCQYCGSDLVFMPNLTQRIRERAAERGIRIERVSGKGFNLLADAGGIGAFIKTTRASKMGLD
jgi:uncharacterized protein (DUF2267 family)